MSALETKNGDGDGNGSVVISDLPIKLGNAKPVINSTPQTVAKQSVEEDAKTLNSFQVFLLEAAISFPIFDMDALDKLIDVLQRITGADNAVRKKWNGFKIGLDNYLHNTTFLQLKLWGLRDHPFIQTQLIIAQMIWDEIKQADIDTVEQQNNVLVRIDELDQRLSAQYAPTVKEMQTKFVKIQFGLKQSDMLTKEQLVLFENYANTTLPNLGNVEEYKQIFDEWENHSDLPTMTWNLPHLRTSDIALTEDLHQAQLLSSKKGLKFEERTDASQELNKEIAKITIQPIGDKRLRFIISRDDQRELKEFQEKEEKREADETRAKQIAMEKHEKKRKVVADMKEKSDTTPTPQKDATTEEEDEIQIPEDAEVLIGVGKKLKLKDFQEIKPRRLKQPREIRQELSDCVVKLFASWDVKIQIFASELMLTFKDMEVLVGTPRQLDEPGALERVYNFLVREFFTCYSVPYMI